MTPTKIIVKNGYGREENPFPTDVTDWHYINFESTVKSLPVVGEVEDGTYQAECIWQWLNPYTATELWQNEENENSHNHSISHGYKTRQAYRIIPADEKGKLIQMAESYADGIYVSLTPTNTQKYKIWEAAKIDFIAGSDWLTAEIEAIIDRRIERYQLELDNDILSKKGIEYNNVRIAELNHILKEIS